jgi:hypothetical protein
MAVSLLEELRPQLQRFPELVATLARQIAPELHRQRPAAGGGFSLVEQVWHLADLEREAFGVRIHRLLTERAPVLPDFPGARIARERRYHEQDISLAVDLFTAARASNLRLLGALGEEDWARAGEQEGVGRISLYDLPGKMADHDHSHAAELVELVEELGAPLAAQIFESVVPLFAKRSKA